MRTELVQKIYGLGQKQPSAWIDRVLRAKLWSMQAKVADALVQHERVAVPAAFGVGKTYGAAQIALQFLYSHYPSKVITTAPTHRQVKDLLWKELRAAHKRTNGFLGGRLKVQELEIDEDWFAVGFATMDYDPDRFTGYHSPHLLLIFDQAAGIERMIWEAGEGLMTSAHVRWLAIGNTTDATSEFANICIPDRGTDFGDWEVMKIRATESPNIIAGKNVYPGLISYDWLEKRKRAWKPGNPLWRIFVEAEFVESDEMVLFTQEAINSMFTVPLPPDWDEVRIGLDVAWTGVDMTVWHIMAGPRLLTIKVAVGNDPMVVVGKTVKLVKWVEGRSERPVEAIRVDTIGVGAGIYSRLDELGYPVESIMSSSSPEDKEQYANLRAEVGWTLRERGEAGEISFVPLWPTHQEYLTLLRQDMNQIRYTISSTGKVALEKKEHIKKRLKRSPDFYDSAALATDPSAAPTFHLVPAEEQYDPEVVKEEEELFIKKLYGDLSVVDLEKDFQDVEIDY